MSDTPRCARCGGPIAGLGPMPYVEWKHLGNQEYAFNHIPHAFVPPAETPKCQRCGHSNSYHGINGIPNGGDCTHRLGSPEKYFNVEGGDFDCDCPAYVRLPRLRGPGGEAVTPAEQEAGK